jgi:5S rRNA maturation endonuclease (ribonuclease M5)
MCQNLMILARSGDLRNRLDLGALPPLLQRSLMRPRLVEGEKDVDTLRGHGFVATTNAGGAKAPWLSDFTESLRGREVILIPDNDEPGRARVLTIARALLGKAARLADGDQLRRHPKRAGLHEETYKEWSSLPGNRTGIAMR